MDLGRRGLLRACGGLAALAATAGCFTATEPRVRIRNETTATLAVTVEITDLDAGETLVAETVELRPVPDGDNPDDVGEVVYDRPVREGSTYRVAVTADGLEGSTEYDARAERLWVNVKEDRIEFLRVTP